MNVTSRLTSLLLRRVAGRELMHPWIPKWMGVLRLSTMWDMERLRELAIRKLTPLLLDKPQHAFEQLIAARTMDMPRWEVSAIAGLIMRREPLSDREADMLDSLTVAHIFREREAKCMWAMQHMWDTSRSPTVRMFSAHCQTDDYSTLVWSFGTRH
jgi:hypothetical protein